MCFSSCAVVLSFSIPNSFKVVEGAFPNEWNIYRAKLTDRNPAGHIPLKLARRLGRARAKDRGDRDCVPIITLRQPRVFWDNQTINIFWDNHHFWDNSTILETTQSDCTSDEGPRFNLRELNNNVLYSFAKRLPESESISKLFWVLLFNLET